MDVDHAPKRSHAIWLRALLDLFFSGQEDVRHRVLLTGWKDLRPWDSPIAWIGVEVHVNGWHKRFQIPTSMVDAEDVGAIFSELAKQSQGALLVAQSSIRQIEEFIH